MTPPDSVDWDDAYDNSAHIPGSRTYPQIWAERAAAFRRQWPMATLDLRYGEHARERIDLFLPRAKTRGLAAFIHGGYWMRLDKSYWSDLAEGALAAGWAVAIPSYSLAPEVRIATITRQVGSAIEAAAGMVAGPVHLAGHSAGGHLVTRMVCRGAPLAPEVVERITRVVSISGLHDLRPLMKTKMNAILGIGEAEATAESPALLEPVGGVPVTAWVGGGERPEFIRQARLLADAWPEAELYVEEDRHHFNVLDGLRQADAPLARAFFG